jgi:hypothetical protein
VRSVTRSDFKRKTGRHSARPAWQKLGRNARVAIPVTAAVAALAAVPVAQALTASPAKAAHVVHATTDSAAVAANMTAADILRTHQVMSTYIREVAPAPKPVAKHVRKAAPVHHTAPVEAAAAQPASSSSGSSGSSGSAGSSGSSGSGSAGTGTTSTTVSCTGTAGPEPENVTAIVNFLMANGYTGTAAAGIAGNIYQESGGNPESVGSGGGGLIGWTPLPSGYITGDVSADLETQLQAILVFNDQWSEYIPELNDASSPADAALIYVTDFERAGIPAADNREAAATAVAEDCGI